MCQRWQKLATLFSGVNWSPVGKKILTHAVDYTIAFKAHPHDTVATLLDDAERGNVRVLGSDGHSECLTSTESIKRGHKIALKAMDTGHDIIKYGIVIGTAGHPIPHGAWVHLHNCVSGFDERSASLDLETGAPSDTRYG